MRPGGCAAVGSAAALCWHPRTPAAEATREREGCWGLLVGSVPPTLPERQGRRQPCKSTALNFLAEGEGTQVPGHPGAGRVPGKGFVSPRPGTHQEAPRQGAEPLEGVLGGVGAQPGLDGDLWGWGPRPVSRQGLVAPPG